MISIQLKQYATSLFSQCSNDIFPIGIITDDNSKKLIKQQEDNKKKTCLTCSKIIIAKRYYPNKYIIYDNKEACLCCDCSVLGLNAPVRDSDLDSVINWAKTK